MSFGGSVSEMITALKGNKSLLGKAKKHGFKANNLNGIYSDKKGESLAFKKVSKKELTFIKEKMQLKLKEDRDKRIKILFVSLGITVLLIIWVFVYILDFF